MKALILGYPYSGKTFFLDAISSSITAETQRQVSNIRNIKVTDKRLEKLRDIFKPKKYTPAEINVVDNYISLSDFTHSKTIFTRETLENIAKSEVIVLVIRVYESEESPYFKENIEPFTDLKNLVEEMCFLDLISAEKRIERLKKENKKNQEFDILNKCYEILQLSKPVVSLDMSEDELAQMPGFKFITQNKIIAVLNTGDNFKQEELKKIEIFCADKKIDLLTLNAKIEFEISQLDNENDKHEFLLEYGLTEPVSDRFVRKLHESLGYISFFTVGPDEVKAWNIRKNTPALKAAGKIHSDIERGFIRAEIVDSSVFLEYKGNNAKLKSDGKNRLEGKEYIVKDGEIINFRFNV